MTPKQIIYSDDARQKLLTGATKLAAAVVTTLGPRGRNVAIDKKWGGPSVIHDGVSVAKEVELEDPFENMGAQMVKEAASKTNDAAGDGTTTATLLAKELISAGMKNVTAGSNPMLMKKGIDKEELYVKQWNMYYEYVLVGEYKNKTLYEGIKVTDAEVRDEYEKNKTKFK